MEDISDSNNSYSSEYGTEGSDNDNDQNFLLSQKYAQVTGITGEGNSGHDEPFSL